MPEHAEIRLLAEFFNENISERKIVKAEKNPVAKRNVDLSWLTGSCSAVATSRGKEFKLTFKKADEEKKMILTFSKVGSIRWINSINDVDHKFGDLVVFHLDDGSAFTLFDFTRWSTWRWDDWASDRGPDPILEHAEFRDNFWKRRKYEFINKRPVFQVMMHQSYFNGVGNVLRCEILGRCSFSPFTTFGEILENEKFREELFETTKSVLTECYDVGGLQFAHWKNPYGRTRDELKVFLRFYNNKVKCFFAIDVCNKNQKFWYDKFWSMEYFKWTERSDLPATTLTRRIYRENQLKQLRKKKSKD